MMKKRPGGFVFAELLIATFIVIITMVIAFEAFMSMSKNSKVLVTYLTSYLKGREAIDVISKDCRIATRVMDSYAGYTTADDCLILKVPSLDSLGNIIDVNKNFDYIIYRINNGNLWKTVIPGTGSSREARDGVFKKDIESFFVSSGGTGLGSITHKSAITYLTLWAAISGDIVGKAYTVNTGTTVKLMNYEWEYVR